VHACIAIAIVVAFLVIMISSVTVMYMVTFPIVIMSVTVGLRIFRLSVVSDV
jgi:hypothetical protein